MISGEKKSKRDYYNQYFENNRNDIKKTWDGIRSIINTKESTIPKITQLNVNNTIITPRKL